MKGGKRINAGRKSEGRRQVSLWLSQESVRRMQELRSRGVRVNRALDTLIANYYDSQRK